MFVCASCVEDAGLAIFVQAHLVSEECDFCGTTDRIPIAADLDDVLDFMDDKISEEYDDPSDSMSYCTEEGGWLGEVFEGSEIFYVIGFGVDNEQLQYAIELHFSGRLFCQRDWLSLTPSDRVLSAWERFKDVVKHERRYTFWMSHDDGEYKWHPDHLPPSHMLSEIAETLQKIDLLTVIPTGTEFWRARVHDAASPLTSAHEYTSPPTDQARQPNRMSPAGVPMFYASADENTAYLETVDPERLEQKCVSSACFEALQPLNMLDLTSIPAIDSFFAVDRDTRHAIRFLKEFARDVACPIERDGREHIDYVPTQVFTEYVRFELASSDGRPIDGIKYRSSKNDEPCYVVFATQEQCLALSDPDHRQLLAFVEGSIRQMSKPRVVDSNAKIFGAGIVGPTCGAL